MRILLVSFYAPSRGHAGGQRLIDLYQQIRKLKPEVYLELLTCKQSDVDWGYDEVYKIFDKIHWLKVSDFSVRYLRNHEILDSGFDIIDLQYSKSGKLIDLFKRVYSNSLIVYSPMEVHLRAFYLLISNPSNFFRLKVMGLTFIAAVREVIYIYKADMVCCVSDADSNSIFWLKSRDKLVCIPTAVPDNAQPNGKFDNIDDNYIETKRSLIFFAYFGSQTNRDSLIWFCNLVHPIIKKQISEYELKVIGRGLDADLIALLSEIDSVNLLGEIDNPYEELKYAVAGIAPALSGSGVRGKIHQYAICELPCVASALGVSGLKYIDGDSVLIAHDYMQFAEHCVELLIDNGLASSIGRQAKKVCLDNYTWDSMANLIRDLYHL